MRATASYQLIDNQGGGYVIGAEGETYQNIKRNLIARYGIRLYYIDNEDSRLRNYRAALIYSGELKRDN